MRVTRDTDVADLESVGSRLSSVPVAPTRTPRVGIIGGGFMGRVHARAARVAGAELVGIVAATPESSRRAALEAGLPGLHETAADLIADVDLVHVCTPNNSHAEFAHAAIAAGRHVICEKPLAMDVAVAVELTRAAREAGVIAAVPFVYRFHPMVREARHRISGGPAAHLIHGSYLQDWLLRPTDTDWRVDPGIGGASRAFADIGSHWCDLAEFVTGDRIAVVNARASTVIPYRGSGGDAPVVTEDVMTVQFQTESGASGSTVISQVSAGRKNRLLLEISTAEATYTFDQEQSEHLWVGGRDESRVLIRDPERLSPEAVRYARIPAGHAQGYQDCFDHFVGDVVSAIAGTVPDGLPLFEDGLRAARVAQAVLASALDGRWTEVPC